ncbi:Metallo-hydrolase/oxidoreductase [Colletotrichum caudatum]|nr:Metallo-hydrolase/oxidoreductase [Colletotrichum caudatum]
MPAPLAVAERLGSLLLERIGILKSSHDRVSDLFNVTTFPNEQKDNVTKWLAKACATAGVELYPYFAHCCIFAQLYIELLSGLATPGLVTLRKVLDCLYFVGQSFVSAWAYDTGEGLVVFDSLDNVGETENILIPNLKALEFAGTDIKHLVITHEHFDHYDGVRCLTGARNGPLKDKTIAEGDELTVGNVTLKFHETPGHTPGTISAVFSVYDNGVEHNAGFSGGVGFPSAAAAKAQQIASLNRFADLGLEAGVDTVIADHQSMDRSLYHFDLPEHRHSGSENPFVIGADAAARYFRFNVHCTRVQSARDGQDLQV